MSTGPEPGSGDALAQPPARPPAATTPAQTHRYGFELAGFRLLTPMGQPAEYLARVAVYPVPLGPRRLQGLLHLRGLPVPVFDASADPPTDTPILRRLSVLVVVAGEETAGLLTVAPPRPVELNDTAVPADEHCPFATALLQGAPDRTDGQVWWQVDYGKLFRWLAAQ